MQRHVWLAHAFLHNLKRMIVYMHNSYIKLDYFSHACKWHLTVSIGKRIVVNVQCSKFPEYVSQLRNSVLYGHVINIFLMVSITF